MLGLQLSHREINGVMVIEVTGRVTIGQNANALADYLCSLMEAGSNKLILNLAAVTFMDSMGVGSIVAAYKSAIGQGGTLKLVKPNNIVKLLLETSGLNRLFEIFDNEDAAVASFADQGSGSLL